MSTLSGCCPQLKEVIANGSPVIGNIPPQIGMSFWQSLVKLELDNTDISGIIPESLFQIPTLQVLFLGSTNVSGNLPAAISSPLEELGLQNRDYGTTKLGTAGNFLNTLLSCTNLTYLYLDGQRGLNGSIPSNIGSSWPKLTELYLGGTGFSGAVPTSIGNLTALQELSLSGNPKLTGPLPAQLANLTQLMQLSLDNCNFTGTVPDLSKLVGLRKLELSGNRFLSGAFPSFVRSWPDLSVLFLASCNFSGPIPTWVSYLQNLESMCVCLPPRASPALTPCFAVIFPTTSSLAAQTHSTTPRPFATFRQTRSRAAMSLRFVG